MDGLPVQLVVFADGVVEFTGVEDRLGLFPCKRRGCRRAGVVAEVRWLLVWVKG